MKYILGNRSANRWQKRVILSVLSVIGVGLIVGSLISYKSHHQLIKVSAKLAGPETIAAKQQVPQTVNGKYLFTGTVMYGRAVEKLANGNQNQPFSGMSTLGTFDATTGVLECPITNGNVDYQTQITSLRFNCRPEWLPTVKKYFPIFNLSSNHLEDMGPMGYSETQSRLTTAGFQTVGNYNPHVANDDCKPVLLPIHIQTDGSQLTTANIPVAYCSYNYKILFSPTPGELESIAKWSKLMPVIALMNGGPEYMHMAGSDQTNVAHKMIDQGADFVVGDGAHWAQNTEVYKNKLIVYSMGNFIFDQTDEDGRNAMNLSVSMSLKYDSNLANWIKLSSSCLTNADSCLSNALAQKLLRIQPTYNFNEIVSTGGYQSVTTKANATEQAYIEMRTNWSATQALLKTSRQ